MVAILPIQGKIGWKRNEIGDFGDSFDKLAAWHLTTYERLGYIYHGFAPAKMPIDERLK
jgi:hypothetical protein